VSHPSNMGSTSSTQGHREPFAPMFSGICERGNSKPRSLSNAHSRSTVQQNLKLGIPAYLTHLEN
jgi:hypothetical protein